MKKATYITLVLGAFLFTGLKAKAQNYNPDYKFAAGLKFGGFENGISSKYFLTPANSIEALIGFRSHGVVFTGLYEWNVNKTFNVDGLRFYYGFGAHLGGVGKGVYKRFNGDNENYNSNQILTGADGIVGMEYVIPRSPIAVSFDLNPRIELATGPFFDIAPGLGVKYCF